MSDSRPPAPPLRRCIVSVDGVRCPNQPRFPNRDESSFCEAHDDSENPETKAWMNRGVAREHKSGEHHEYRLECTVCGQLGQVQLSIEPQRAE